jgi:voltage-dependent calcium channel L type alpha-1D
MIVFCFFLLNLFVGVVVMTFHEQKEKLGKNFLLTDTQKEWLGIKMRLLRTKPMLTKTTLSSNIIRKVCYKIVRNKAFKIFILVCIILNSVVLTLNWYLMPESIININSYLSYGFTVVFFIEAALKIIGLGKTYFKSNKNILDFFILLA